ncbi:tegument protein UL16 [Macacine alphaherpesvirus 1]|uniref:UL16 n=1 Tax=Cercopithecine herpesvirus 1 (strain E2490) TaxID=260965 RepID=Q7T5E6_CHV1E|nr:tegument protein UL16 [Macacine alphaherpesvirus 1]AAP41434.1 UL16 [Macacine alphaherpesvirus 1]ARS01877.1 tegument protein UL16 [Macacine alphaherpesvirus 1]ARS01952.1 tegument protein UL16 [Macacine alphaherpesvirus 1]ARS02401.1 tegument protein UL16 [Macacine alphaherpesvirus 1]ARS02610.1 tegument protein UL16 [Macacine alphaherpesvirus 1]
MAGRAPGRRLAPPCPPVGPSARGPAGGAGSPAAPGIVELDTCADAVASVANSIFVWRLVRGDERIKIFRCVTALTGALCQVAVPPPDPRRALFCEVFLYLTRPRALRLPPGAFFAIFLFNRERRYCATTHVRSVNHPLAPSLRALTFTCLKAAAPPEESPDPAAERLDATPLAFELAGPFLVPAEVPRDPSACCALGPGAWWHFPSGQIYCWAMDEALGELCPPGSRARHLGWLLARLTNHPGGCGTCAPQPHADSVNALWESAAVAEACPCVAPCMWAKMAQRVLAIEGDGSLRQLLFARPVDAVVLLGSTRGPRIAAHLHEVVGGQRGAERIRPQATGWRLCALSSYASRLFATSCPTIARVVAR